MIALIVISSIIAYVVVGATIGGYFHVIGKEKGWLTETSALLGILWPTVIVWYVCWKLFLKPIIQCSIRLTERRLGRAKHNASHWEKVAEDYRRRTLQLDDYSLLKVIKAGYDPEKMALDYSFRRGQKTEDDQLLLEAEKEVEESLHHHSTISFGKK
jgi:hypothetical protein